MKIYLDQDSPNIPTRSKFRNISLKEGLSFRVEDCLDITEAAFIENLSKIHRDKNYISVTVGISGQEFEDVVIKFPFILRPSAPEEFSVCSEDFITARPGDLERLKINLLQQIIAKDYHIKIIDELDSDDGDYCPTLTGLAFRLIRNDHEDWSEEVFIPQEQADKILVLTEDPELDNYDPKQEAIYDSLRREEDLDEAADEIAAASRC